MYTEHASSEELVSFFKTQDDGGLAWLGLLGLRITGLRVAVGEGAFAFVFDTDDAFVMADKLSTQGDAAGPALAYAMTTGAVAFVVDCVGDCCSESWLADVVGIDTLLGQHVVNVREIELPAHLTADVDEYGESPRSRQQVDRVYGWEVTTAKGVCTLAMRNSSNGYYGGWLECKGFVGAQAIEGWRSITEDWSA